MNLNEFTALGAEWHPAQPTITQRIDGLRLEWVQAYTEMAVAKTEVGVYRVAWSMLGGYVEPPCGSRWPIDSIDDGKQLALKHYKQRVRAIFGSQPQRKD